eukprot:TCALIF_06122-PA protein Name:"Protein of unknown function" AED:0.25 eAED:0.25 QI:70/0/0.5/0.5/0/0.5/2/2530/79
MGLGTHDNRPQTGQGTEQRKDPWAASVQGKEARIPRYASSFVCGECRLDRGHDNGQHGERNTSYCPDVLLSKAQPESVL